MGGWKRPRWKWFFAGLAAAAAGAVLVGATGVLSGVYHVGADTPHFTVTSKLIRLALHRSVATHSMGLEVPDLSEAGLAVLGREHFQFGCVPCHGPAGPGERSPIAARIYPAPPPIREAIREWETDELFWIVKHGLKMTGMPAWVGTARDAEVWAVVAYLESLRGPEPEARSAEDRAGRPLEFDVRADMEFCAECHGDADSPPVTGIVPALQGQSQAYLARAMAEYRTDQRQSGIMEPIAAALDPAATARLVEEYARASPPTVRTEADAQLVAQGREIAERGSPDDQIPACMACHSGRASEQFPVLAGLSSDYIAVQLKLFAEGHRNQTAYGRIMTAIAERLEPEQIEAVAAYLASLPLRVQSAEPRAVPQ